jgi:hypothetical protein
MAKQRNFESPEDLMNWIREKSDDLVEVQLLSTEVQVTARDGNYRTVGAGARLLFLDGKHSIIPREYADRLIKDGLLDRMQIKVTRLE